MADKRSKVVSGKVVPLVCLMACMVGSLSSHAVTRCLVGGHEGSAKVFVHRVSRNYSKKGALYLLMSQAPYLKRATLGRSLPIWDGTLFCDYSFPVGSRGGRYYSHLSFGMSHTVFAEKGALGVCYHHAFFRGEPVPFSRRGRRLRLTFRCLAKAPSSETADFFQKEIQLRMDEERPLQELEMGQAGEYELPSSLLVNPGSEPVSMPPSFVAELPPPLPPLVEVLAPAQILERATALPSSSLPSSSTVGLLHPEGELTLFLEAVKRGDKAELEILKHRFAPDARSALINHKDAKLEGLPVLHWVVENDTPIFQHLLTQWGGNPMERSINNCTLLMRAARLNKVEAMGVLRDGLRNPVALLRLRDNEGKQAIHYATEAATDAALRHLHETWGAKLSTTVGVTGKTLLMEAAARGNVSVLRYAFQHFRPIDRRLTWVNRRDITRMTALDYASEAGHLDAVELLRRFSGR